MNEAIELLCQKLGTTLDKLVPAVIQFGIHNTKIFLTISIIAVVIGICLIIAGICVANRDEEDYFNEPESIIFMMELTGAICIAVGLAILIICIVRLHYWHTFPELQAYQTILRWVSGK